MRLSRIHFVVFIGLMAAIAVAQADPVYTYTVPTNTNDSTPPSTTPSDSSTTVYYYVTPPSSGNNSGNTQTNTCLGSDCYYTISAGSPVTPSPTPEPASLGLMLSGIAAGALALKIRRRARG